MFFTILNDMLTYANVISSPDFELTIETRNDYEYPKDGWYWFDTEEEAKVFFNIQEITNV